MSSNDDALTRRLAEALAGAICVSPEPGDAAGSAERLYEHAAAALLPVVNGFAADELETWAVAAQPFLGAVASRLAELRGGAR